MNVIGCLLKDPSILSRVDKYKIKLKDFEEKMTQAIFMAISNLHKNGNNSIGIVEIEAYLSQIPDVYKLYQGENKDGQTYLNDAQAIANTENFEYYYNRMKKFTILRDLKKENIPITNIFDESESSPRKIRETMENFDQLGIRELLDRASVPIAKIKNEYSGAISGKTGRVSDQLEELLTELEQTPEIGFPVQGDILNTIVRGARITKYYLNSGATGSGKALPNSTKIPTPDGWKTVGEIKYGDYLFDGFGKPTKVIGVFPQGKKEVYEITFKDGRKAKCCEDHLWSFIKSTQKQNARKNRKFNTASLKEIIKEGIVSKDRKHHILIPVNKPVEYSKKEYCLDPYFIGLFLGDGSLRFIPKEYLLGSIEQRYSLIQGLLDTDGSVDEKGRVSFTTISEELKNNFLELCFSLGMLATVCEDKRKNKYEKIRVWYQINIETSLDNKLNLFKLSRKKEKIIEEQLKNKRREKKEFNPIVKIEELKYEEDMTCFLVDNLEHLFLMNDYIVTHNSRLAIGDATNLAIPFKYDKLKKKWINSGCAQKVCFITTELSPDELQTVVLAHLADVNEEKILFNSYEDDEKQRVLEAKNYIEEYKDNFYWEHIPDPCMESVSSVIRFQALSNHVDHFFYDYIFTSPALINQFSGAKIREDRRKLCPLTQFFR